MMDLRFVLENMELVKLGSYCKGYQFGAYFWEDLETWSRWLKLEEDTLQTWYAKRKTTQDREALKYIAGEIKYQTKEVKKLKDLIGDSLKQIPNLPADDVPVSEKLGTFGELRAKLSSGKYAEEVLL